MANMVYPDQTPYFAASYLGLHRHQEEEETDKTKQAQTEQMYEKH